MKHFSDEFVAVFNSSESDRQQAKEDFIGKFGPEKFRVAIKPYLQKGIMSIFNDDANIYTKYYVERIAQYSDDREYKRSVAYKHLPHDQGSKAKSLMMIKDDIPNKDYIKLQSLYGWLKQMKLRPRIVEIVRFDTFYSITIQTQKTHRQAETTQQDFFDMGFDSATYYMNEKIEVGLNLKRISKGTGAYETILKRQ
jgi:hypothetical protein